MHLSGWYTRASCSSKKGHLDDADVPRTHHGIGMDAKGTRESLGGAHREVVRHRHRCPRQTMKEWIVARGGVGSQRGYGSKRRWVSIHRRIHWPCGGGTDGAVVRAIDGQRVTCSNNQHTPIWPRTIATGSRSCYSAGLKSVVVRVRRRRARWRVNRQDGDRRTFR